MAGVLRYRDSFECTSESNRKKHTFHMRQGILCRELARVVLGLDMAEWGQDKQAERGPQKCHRAASAAYSVFNPVRRNYTAMPAHYNAEPFYRPTMNLNVA